MGREGVNGKVNKKVLAVGAVTLAALAAMAMVYYSAYSTATVKAERVLWVSISKNLRDVTLEAPGIWANEYLGTVRVTKDNTSGDVDSLRYRLILEATFSGSYPDLSKVRSLAIAVYDESGDLKGFLTPWTPTLVIDNSTWDPSGNTSDADTYKLKLNGVAFEQTSSSITLGVKASVEILSLST